MPPLLLSLLPLLLASPARAVDGTRSVLDAATEEAEAPKAKKKKTRTDPDLGTPPVGQLPPDLREVATKVRNQPLADRMKAVSDPLIGKPYMLDPLGEGDGHDADPFARYDAFDCLTFLEEVVALSVAGDPVHASPVRMGLRYGTSEPAYENRNHFMEMQWIPKALEAGWMRDATADYGATERYTREMNDDAWARWSGRRLFPLPDDKLPKGEMALDVLPIETAMAKLDQIKPGSVLLSVRDQSRPWVPYWISHVGFVVHKDGKPMFRHASTMGKGKVQDNTLAWYLRTIAAYPNWPTSGVAILEPVEMGPRLSLLPEGWQDTSN